MVDDDDGDESHSPEPRTDSRSALLRGFRAWRRFSIVKRDESFSLIFSPRTRIYGVGVEVGGASGGPRGRGAPRGQARPPPSWTGCGPPGLDSFASIFYISQKVAPWILLKTASVQVSFKQIMQVRVQNKGKSVWKSRYDGDVSLSHSYSIASCMCSCRLFHVGTWISWDITISLI